MGEGGLRFVGAVGGGILLQDLRLGYSILDMDGLVRVRCVGISIKLGQRITCLTGPRPRPGWTRRSSGQLRGAGVFRLKVTYIHTVSKYILMYSTIRSKE